MISIQYLFEDMEDSSVPKKYKKRMSRKCDVFKGFEDSLPDIEYPEVGTVKFEEELDEVRRCIRNKSLSQSFLDLSDKNSENIFKKFLKEEDFDWSSLKKVLKELDGVLLRLKFKHPRRRPFEHFRERGEEIETKVAHSPSFPSGHTAFAYFICDILSEKFPNRQMELQSLAEMIGQSRIENGVHFPSDVSAGRYVGEQAAKHFIERGSVNENIVNRNSHKTFVKFLRRKAKSFRSNFSKREAYEYYVNDMSSFVFECCNSANARQSYDACRRLIEGYPLEKCSENKEITMLFEGMVHLFFNNQTSSRSIVRLHNIIEEKTTIRNFEKSTLSGMSYAPSQKINEMIEKVSELNDRPFLKMATLSWVSPFTEGNEKITNLIFLKETGFNFDISNQIITDELDFMLENFYRENRMENILS